MQGSSKKGSTKIKPSKGSDRALGSSANSDSLKSEAKKPTGEVKTDQVMQPPQRHRMEKITVTYPTWCIFANQFIWGLDKTCYKCSECGMIASRKHIALAKKTVCSTDFAVDVLAQTDTSAVKKTSKVFTIHLPQGAKKSMIMSDDLAKEQLRATLEKICRQRAIPMEEYFPQDGNGKVVPLTTILSKIEGGEITFTKKESSGEVDYRGIPPLIADVEAKMFANRPASAAPPAKPLTAAPVNSPRPTASMPVPAGQTPAPSSEFPTAEPKKVVERVSEVYKFEQELGNGAFSVVYQAKHKRTGEIVAIKVLDRYKEEQRQIMKLKREIAIHQNLEHENIIRFIQLDEDEEHFYVVMELVTGGELFDQICRQKYYHERDAGPLLAQLVQGLIYLHDRGISHRDIKPENLLFKNRDLKQMKIADFGESKSHVTGTLRTYCGTPDYMAPEIIKGLPYGPEVDMWAVGVTAFVMIGGYAPFEGENDSEVFASILTLSYKFISPEWDHCGPLGKEFIDSLLKLDAKQRLTARQCLAHPFLAKFVNAADLVPPALPVQGDDSKKKLGDLDQKSPKASCLQAIEQTVQILKTGTTAGTEMSAVDKNMLGELAYMKQVLELTTGGGPADKNVYSLTWNRLKDIRDIRFI